MVTEHELEQMRRGFVGTGVVLAPLVALAALVAVLLGESWALWPLAAVLIAEAAFVVVLVRRRRSR
ncbi:MULTISPECIES: hypothetical protein [unclassified Curtobacterium]|uniref:hypothetical protein n=1 Tax=unclassified Curtobacterium TaxID=257496 RepID=UPI0008DEA35B|nr:MULTISPECIES: hypothetical protein [unclassified Curtobacterium]OIH99578.1 hypothetical protein BIU92_01425 [Curtobacterium sp. MCBA15_003]OII30587.1 hypothetical protein BIU94_07470 [Curtobacterium sp. MMLR14_006]